MTAYERLRDALESNGKTVKDNGHGRLSAQCPAHNDGNPSLSVTAIEGSVLLYCHAGCQVDDVLAAVEFTKADLFDNRRDTTYPYPGGRQVRRSIGKRFSQSGIKTDRSLFHADRIADAADVLVVEGEKDVLAAEAAGSAAVCSAMGAGKAHRADWTPLHGKHVTVIPDDDEPGRKHAAQVVELVTAAGAASVRLARPAVGKDLADHIAAGKSIEELLDIEAVIEVTTWEPHDLGPWLDGTHVSPKPTLGISRTDGQQLIYPGKEHSLYGETEAGKTWFVAQCAAAEMRLGRDVVYIHYEEGDPGSTIERLRDLGVTDADIRAHLRFVAPGRPGRPGWLQALLDPPPVLVIHDGVNEAMSLHGDDSMATDGAATFRRNLIKPCLAVGAATISCDHVTKSAEGRGRYAIGAGHKVAAIDGAAFMVENIEPFGRGMRGASSVYVTKDRPGQLRAHGKPTGLPGKTLIGVLAVDATGNTPDFLVFHAPGNGDKTAEQTPAESLTDEIYKTLVAMPDHTVKSGRELRAAMRDAGIRFTTTAGIAAVDDLLFTGRISEIPGRNKAVGYRALVTTPSVSEQSPSSGVSSGVSWSVSPIGEKHSETLTASGSRNTPKHSETLGSDPTGPSCTYCGKPIGAHMHAAVARGYCNHAACLEAAKGAAE